MADSPKRFFRVKLVRIVATALFVGSFLLYASTMACLLYTSPSPRDRTRSRMPSSA